jgi:hypothetical protein
VKILAALAPIICLGCSMASEDIKPRKMSDVPYALRSCQELTARLRDTEAQLAERSRENDETGKGSLAEIAELKGTRDVIIETRGKKNCPPA